MGANYKAKAEKVSVLRFSEQPLGTFTTRWALFRPRVPRRLPCQSSILRLGHGKGRVFPQRAMTAKLLERQGRASAHWLVAASPTANAEGAPRVPTPSLHDGSRAQKDLVGQHGTAHCGQLSRGASEHFPHGCCEQKGARKRKTHLSMPVPFRQPLHVGPSTRQSQMRSQQGPSPGTGLGCISPVCKPSLGIWAELTLGWSRLLLALLVRFACSLVSSCLPPWSINRTLDRDPRATLPPSVGDALRAPDFSACFPAFPKLLDPKI